MERIQSMKNLAVKMGKTVHHGWLSEGRGLFVREGSMYRAFDPADNDKQAIEVLCWLRNLGVEGCDVLSPYETGPIFQNDGTPESMRKAILNAACKMANQ